MLVYLVCDESGAKGYADVSESYPGETGVFAGLLIPESIFNNISQNLKIITTKYFNSESKAHITDLPKEKQESLRAEIFNCLTKNKIACIYKAIHVEGFKDEFNRRSSLHKIAKEQKRSPVKITHNSNPDLLHDILFQGMFSTALAFCIDQYENNYELKIMIDNVDKSIFNRFCNKAKGFTDMCSQEYTKEHDVTGFNGENGKIVSGSIKTTIEFPESLCLDEVDYSKISIVTTEMGNNALTIAADVLANSIYHHFRSRKAEEIGKPLHNVFSIKNHPLADLFYGLLNDEESNEIFDAIYMYKS